MKKKVLLGLILLVGIVTPFIVKADTTYNALTFRQALQEEDIAISDSSYKETDDQITIYLFRGKGCGYCRAYLTYMNSILKDYGKYFKMVSFEVWNNEDNAKLLTEVSNKMDNPAEGVPYIIIGDKVFPGYAEQYNDQIKEAITTLYKTKESKRYDIIKEMNIKYNIEEDVIENNASKGESKTNTLLIILFDGLFIAIATAVIILFENKRFNKLEKKLNIIKKRVKKDDKEKKNTD